MRSLRISEEYRVELAQTLLRESALYRWHDRENWVGHERGWFVFHATMIAAFHMVDDMTTWTRTAERFRQRPRETIRSYFDRFDLEIVETYSNFSISELLSMQIFSLGIHPYFRPPRPYPPFRPMGAMRKAYLAYVNSIYLLIPYPENVALRFVRTHLEPAPAAPAQDVPHDRDNSEDDDSETKSEIEVDGGDPDYDPRHDD